MLLVNNVFVSNIKEMHVTVDVKSEKMTASERLGYALRALNDAKAEFVEAIEEVTAAADVLMYAQIGTEARNHDFDRLVERQVFPQSAAAWDNARAQLERDLGLSKGPDAYRDAGNALPTGSIFETRGVSVKGADNKTVEVGREAKDAGWYKPFIDGLRSKPTPYPTNRIKLERGMVVQLSGGNSPHFALPLGKPLVVVDITDDRSMAALAYGATERWVPLDWRIQPWQ
jgi:hypothetical protein